MKITQLFAGLLMCGALAACGGGSSGSSSGTLTVSPASVSVAAGSTQLYTVTNGTGDTITWQVNGITGGNASVGTISSGGLYTAPDVPPVSQPVSITAMQDSNTGSAAATVTYSNASLNGQFVFTFSELSGGVTTNAVGLITADGSGNITGTENVSGISNPVSVSGHYSLSANGQGTLTIDGGNAGTLTLTLSLVAGATEGILTDATSGNVGGGTLYLQTGQVNMGTDLNGNYTVSLGASAFASNNNSIGIITLTSPTITGTNFDVNNGGAYTLYNTVGGSYMVVSENYGTLSLTLGTTTTHYVFYAVSPSQLELMCTDTSCTNTGELDAQSTQAVSAGTYVYELIGSGTGQTPDALMGIGSVTPTSATTGSMNLTMFENYNGSYLSITNGTTYTLSTTGRGMTILPTPFGPGSRNFVFNVQSAGNLNFLETSSGFGNTTGFAIATQGMTTVPAGQYLLTTINQIPNTQSIGTTQAILQVSSSGQVTGQELVNTNGSIPPVTSVSGSIAALNVAGTFAMTLNLSGGQTASYVLAVVVPGDMTVLRSDSAVDAGSLIVQYETQ
ncbi:MAG: hypothetical protein WBR29_09820 [Gammaproteobacteria bacterium]